MASVDSQKKRKVTDRDRTTRVAAQIKQYIIGDIHGKACRGFGGGGGRRGTIHG